MVAHESELAKPLNQLAPTPSTTLHLRHLASTLVAGDSVASHGCPEHSSDKRAEVLTLAPELGGLYELRFEG